MGQMGPISREMKRRKIGREVITDEVRWEFFYNQHGAHPPSDKPMWRGRKMLKLPTDIALYSTMIQQLKPDYIVELGTRFGASALFFADMLEINGKGKVITVDKDSLDQEPHPRVEYLVGDTTDRNLVSKIAGMVSGDVMVILDSNHTRMHVYRELRLYRDIVTKGQYMVVEDCYWNDVDTSGAYRATVKFLSDNKNFVRDKKVSDKFIFSVTRDGWLLKL